MDRVSEGRLSLICPVVADRVRLLYESLKQEGIEIRVTQALRSWNEQDALFHKRPPVTKARGGYSWHNFGLAVDVVPDIDGTDANFTPDWNVNHPSWRRIHQLGESLGFVCGADFRTFPDWPHLQMTGRFPVTPNDEARQIFKDAGMEAVWNEAGLK